MTKATMVLSALEPAALKGDATALTLRKQISTARDRGQIPDDVANAVLHNLLRHVDHNKNCRLQAVWQAWVDDGLDAFKSFLNHPGTTTLE